MKHFLRSLRRLASTAYAQAGAIATTFLINEPVRARALLTSLVVLGGAVAPALAQANVANLVAGIGMAALVAVAGESARAKVSPVDSE